MIFKSINNFFSPSKQIIRRKHAGNMTSIDISNEQKLNIVPLNTVVYDPEQFWCLVKIAVYVLKSWELQDWVIEIISPETSYIIVDYFLGNM